MATDPTHLGSVQDVTGATVRGVLESHTASGLAFIEGHGYRIGQVGSFVRIPLGYVDLFGVVSQVGAGAVPENLAAQHPHGDRWITIQLVGEGYRGQDFRRGISQYPTVGDPIHLVTEQDLARVYGRPDSAQFVRVGHLASAESIPALVDVDRLVTRHCAIVGTTGAGKSTTVASLLSSLSAADRHPSARIMVIDVHGEYATALRDRATVFRVNPAAESGDQPLFVPYWAMTFDELMTVMCGAVDEAARGVFIERVTTMKRQSIEASPRDGVTADSLTADSPVPFSVHQLWFDLWTDLNATHFEKQGVQQSRDTWALEVDAQKKPLQPGSPIDAIPPRFRGIKNVKDDPEKIRLSQSSLNVGRSVEHLTSRLRDPRFAFLFKPGPWLSPPAAQPERDLDALLEAWIGGPKPITVLDVSGIPTSILTELIGVVLRVVYDALFWARNLAEGGRERPLLVVLEEAHAYLGSSDASNAARAARRIVKEGRKYGIGAMIVSQRPAEIDQTVLSQCGTIIAMRLANATDRGHVTSAVSDNLEGLLAMLPVLRTGEAIIVGEAVHLPVRTLIEPPPRNRRPDSSDPRIFDDKGPGGWNRAREPGNYADVVAVWRKQNPRSPRKSEAP
jgi:DNA helicase HerA-like ATPase